MSEINDLILQMCPNGVTFIPFEKVALCVKGEQLNKEKLVNKGYPVINGGVNPSGFWHESNFPANRITISQGGASAGYVNWQKTPFWAGAHCYVIVKEKKNINYRYLYHVIKNYEKVLTECQYGAGIPALAAKTINALMIPVPPIEIQIKIAEVLDSFEFLITNLSKEIDLRKSQYTEIASRELLDRKYEKYDRVSNRCSVIKGKSPIQKSNPGIYPMVVTTPERKTCDTYQFDCKAVCIPLISSRGHGVASLNHVYYQEGKFALGNILCAVVPNKEGGIVPKFLYYYFELTKDYTLVPLMKGGANVAMHVCDIERVMIPIPTIEEQYRITESLSLYDEYLFQLQSELSARKTQFEYYRDKLLTFKEAE